LGNYSFAFLFFCLDKKSWICDFNFRNLTQPVLFTMRVAVIAIVRNSVLLSDFLFSVRHVFWIAFNTFFAGEVLMLVSEPRLFIYPATPERNVLSAG
jgi:hypothetical protein